MHLVVPFAAPLPLAGSAALAGLSLPGLASLLAGRDADRDEGDEWSLTPPHERALARAFGWAGGDGRLPLAAWHAAADGIDPGDLCWGELTPVHWQVGTEGVSLIDPSSLALGEGDSLAMFDAVRELFVGEGFVMRHASPVRWYAAHEMLAEVAAASLDRVAGRNVGPWLAAGSQPPLLRRLLNEAQMVLHALPVNAEREGRGELPVNALWLSGCGALQPAGPGVEVELRLRLPAITEDWPAWLRAFEALDAAWSARAPGRLTLCGERGSASFTLDERRGFAGWFARWQRADPLKLLATL